MEKAGISYRFLLIIYFYTFIPFEILWLFSRVPSSRNPFIFAAITFDKNSKEIKFGIAKKNKLSGPIQNHLLNQ